MGYGTAATALTRSRETGRRTGQPFPGEAGGKEKRSVFPFTLFAPIFPVYDSRVTSFLGGEAPLVLLLLPSTSLSCPVSSILVDGSKVAVSPQGSCIMPGCCARPAAVAVLVVAVVEQSWGDGRRRWGW